MSLLPHHVTLEPVAHKYFDIYGNHYLSVSKFLECFKEKFDSETISMACAKKELRVELGREPNIFEARNRQQVLLAKWAATNLDSTDTGTDIHNAIEDYHNTGIARYAWIPELCSKYFPEYNKLFPEQCIYSKKYWLAGTSDLPILRAKSKSVIDIFDYKGLALDTPIATTTGWKIMNNIEVGDHVFDKDGQPTRVDHVSEIHVNPCYKITFDSNDTLICDHEHRWVISFRQSKSKDKEQIMTTDELFAHFGSKNRNSKVIPKIKCGGSLNLPDANLPIDPYILGAWLGDGSKSCGIITNVNPEFWKEVAKRGYKTSDNLSGDDRAEMRTVLNIRGHLNKLQLLNNKGIPDVYLRSSHAQRLDLLRGLMDTDGYFNERRQRFVMGTTQWWQAEDISKLISSLGWKPTIIKAIKKCNGKKFQGYDVCFRAFENPFLIRNKECMSNLSKEDHTAKYRIITKVEKIKTVLTKCIAVDSKSHTYLAGYNLITTHNTNKSKGIEYVNNYKKWMLGPLSHLEACSYNTYALQLSIYARMLEEHGWKIGRLAMIYIPPAEPEKHFLIPVPYMRAEVELMFSWAEFYGHLKLQPQGNLIPLTR